MHNILTTTLGKVGITLNINWFEPEDASIFEDVEASYRKLAFFGGWFANPILKDGKYPEIMRQKVCVVGPKGNFLLLLRNLHAVEKSPIEKTHS